MKMIALAILTLCFLAIIKSREPSRQLDFLDDNFLDDINPKGVYNKVCYQNLGVTYYAQESNRFWSANYECSITEIVEYPNIDCSKDAEQINSSQIENLKQATKRTLLDDELFDRLPIGVHYSLIERADCIDYHSIFNKRYPDLKFGEYGAKIYFLDSTISRENHDVHKQYYDLGVPLYTQRIEGITFNFLLSQLERNRSLYKKDIVLDNSIILNDNDDLTIEKIKLFTRYFLLETYHELVTVCASDGKGSKYYFIFDRGFIKKTDWTTRVRIVYYAKSDNCDSDNSIWPDTLSGGLSTLRKDGVGYPKNEKMKSLKNFVNATLKYGRDFPMYKLFTENCQHYSTGMYNTLTGKNLDFNDTNMGLMPDFNFYWN